MWSRPTWRQKDGKEPWEPGLLGESGPGNGSPHLYLLPDFQAVNTPPDPLPSSSPFLASSALGRAWSEEGEQTLSLSLPLGCLKIVTFPKITFFDLRISPVSVLKQIEPAWFCFARAAIKIHSELLGLLQVKSGQVAWSQRCQIEWGCIMGLKSASREPRRWISHTLSQGQRSSVEYFIGTQQIHSVIALDLCPLMQLVLNQFHVVAPGIMECPS